MRMESITEQYTSNTCGKQLYLLTGDFQLYISFRQSAARFVTGQSQCTCIKPDCIVIISARGFKRHWIKLVFTTRALIGLSDGPLSINQSDRDIQQLVLYRL